eukprot:c25054_g1_i1 orf=175-2577(-)
MGDLVTKEDLCIAGENITMREINSTLQKMVGTLEECASLFGGERDALSKNSIEYNASKDLHGVDDTNSTKAFEIDHELEVCESLRRQKRKQENMDIHRVKTNLASSNQSILSQHSKGVGEAQKDQVEAVEVEKDTAEGLLQAGSSSQIPRRCKRRLETSQVHAVDFDISFSTDAAHSLHNRLGVGFDISVNSTGALGFKHASCSITQGKDIGAMGARQATGALNNKMKKGLTSTCDEAVGTAVAASVVSNKEIRSTFTKKRSVRKKLREFDNATPVKSPDRDRLTEKLGATMHNDSENTGKFAAELEEVCAKDQTQNQKLRMAVAALRSQFKFLYGLAEEGSNRNCGCCQSIKEEIRKLSFDCGDISADQILATKVATCLENSIAEDAQECSSPVGSCTSEKTAVSNEACDRQISSVLHNRQMESRSPSRKDTFSQKDRGSDLPLRNDLYEDIEEASEAECHLCIELASSQLEDPDTEQVREGLQGGLLETKEYASDKCPLAAERELKSDELHACSDEKQNYAPNVSVHGDLSSEVGKGADSFQAVEDEGECEDLSAKNSKEEDCWNSGLTRNSCDSYDGGIDNQAEKDGYIDLKCGCTSQKHGDTVGTLRLFKNGKLEIHCHCSLGCIKGKPMSPASFERHSGRGASKKWRETIWIFLGDRKVQFSKVKGLDAFVRRYKESNRVMLRQPGPVKQPLHRDEFVQCKKCSKKRRFRRKTKEECRLFHEASMNLEWECSNYPFDSLRSCQDDEEREARQAIRGCIRSRTCQGCIQCVCLGCFSCRFEDCSCRVCVEYIDNNK